MDQLCGNLKLKSDPEVEFQDCGIILFLFQKFVVFRQVPVLDSLFIQRPAPRVESLNANKFIHEKFIIRISKFKFQVSSKSLRAEINRVVSIWTLDWVDSRRRRLEAIQ